MAGTYLTLLAISYNVSYGKVKNVTVALLLGLGFVDFTSTSSTILLKINILIFYVLSLTGNNISSASLYTTFPSFYLSYYSNLTTRNCDLLSLVFISSTTLYNIGFPFSL